MRFLMDQRLADSQHGKSWIGVSGAWKEHYRDDYFSCASRGPMEDTFVVGYWDGTFEVIDREAQSVTGPVKVCKPGNRSRGVNGITVARGARVIVTVGDDAMIKLWRLRGK